jgi:transcription factor C subunit 6
VRIELDDAACTCLDWANSEIIAVACSNGQYLRCFFVAATTIDQFPLIQGNILVYDLKEALLRPQRGTQGTLFGTWDRQTYFILSPSDDVHSFISLDILPLNCISVAQVAIRSIAWVRTPPANVEGEEDPTKDPAIIASTAYDGSLHLTDTRDPFGHPIFRARGTLPSSSPLVAKRFSKYPPFV